MRYASLNLYPAACIMNPSFIFLFVSWSFIVEELKEKSGYVDWHSKERTEQYGIIARRIDNEVKKDLRSKGYLVYDLDDFEVLMKHSS